jgi:hypothetical protein
LERQLGLARAGLSSSSDARARVRQELASRGAFAPRLPASSKLAASKVAASKVAAKAALSKPAIAALMAASFVAGYWLRDVRTTEPERVAAAVVADAPAQAPPALAAALGANARRAEAVDAPNSTDAAVSADAGVPHEIGQAVREALGATAAASHRAPVAVRAHAAPQRGARQPAARERTSDLPGARVESLDAPALGSTAPSEELRLLRRAERALRAGDPTLALILIDQLDRSHPRSALVEERSAARVLAECARSGELAKPEAGRFLEKYPSSVYSDRVWRACGLERAGIPDSAADVRAGEH